MNATGSQSLPQQKKEQLTTTATAAPQALSTGTQQQQQIPTAGQTAAATIAAMNGMAPQQQPQQPAASINAVALAPFASTGTSAQLQQQQQQQQPLAQQLQQQQQLAATLGNMNLMLPSTAAAPSSATAPGTAIGDNGNSNPAGATVQQQPVDSHPTFLLQQALQSLGATGTAAAAAATSLQPGLTAAAQHQPQQQVPSTNADNSAATAQQQQPQQQQQQFLPHQILNALTAVPSSTASNGMSIPMPPQFFPHMNGLAVPGTVTTVTTAPVNPATNGSSLWGAAGGGQKRRLDKGTKRGQKSSKVDPSVVSNNNSISSNINNNNADAGTFGVAPVVKQDAELKKMTPAERRRYERNLREQQRSYRISQQIKELRDVLASSNIPFKPNKFSILVSVVEYIKQLQSRAIMLDAEHQRLIDTIRQTNEQVISGQTFGEENESLSAAGSGGGTDPSGGNQNDLLLVHGINYRSAFEHCPFAMGVATLDGRVLGCNKEFEEALGCPEDDCLEQSLFMYIRNHQDIFEAMADLLKRSSAATETTTIGEEPTENGQNLLYWCGEVVSLNSNKVGVRRARVLAMLVDFLLLMLIFSDRPLFSFFPFCLCLVSILFTRFVLFFSFDNQLSFTITLTTTADGSPKFFSFTATPKA